MSLRKTPGEAHPQPSTSSNAQRRKTSKRPLVCSDDDDGPLVPTQRMKRARTVDTDASLSVATSSDDNGMDVDVDTYSDSARRSLSADDSRFLPVHDPMLSHKTDASKKRKKLSVVPAPSKKKSQLVYSDDGSDGHTGYGSVEGDLSDSPPPPVEPSDDDFDLDTPPKRGAPKAKAGPAKGKVQAGQHKGTKTKGLKEKERDKEILIKDERKQAVPTHSTSRASSAAAQSQPSELLSNDDHAASSVVDALPDAPPPVKDPLSQAIPKKRKLPPIKKTKTAIGTTGTSTPTTTTQKPPQLPVQELAKLPLPTSEQRKQALTGVRDIDLGDSKIYAELFKGAGGNTPRSGLKNADERRRELDKMRDEARARRNGEAKSTFNLQGQADKIARFEQRLRVENSTVLHPNFLAAKFRDEWELDRRNRRSTPKEEGEA